MNTFQDKTLIDGEITFNYHYSKYCLMILDVVFIEGNCISTKNLSIRLQKIRDEVIVPYRKKYPEISQNDLPFLLLGKDFIKLKDIHKILGRVKQYQVEDEGCGYRFLYNNEKRYNDSEGFLFILEDREYIPWQCTSNKIWKWPPLISAKFKLKVVTKKNGKNLYKLYSKNSNIDEKLVEFKIIYFSKESLKKLKQNLNNNNEAIIDCGFDAKNTGEWIFYNVSHGLPDSTITIAHKLEVIAENILSEELEKIFRPLDRPQTTPHVTIYPPSNHVHSETSPTLDNHNEFEIIDDYNDIDNIKDSIKRKRKQDNDSSLSENEDSVPDKKKNEN